MTRKKKGRETENGFTTFNLESIKGAYEESLWFIKLIRKN